METRETRETRGNRRLSWAILTVVIGIGAVGALLGLMYLLSSPRRPADMPIEVTPTPTVTAALTGEAPPDAVVGVNGEVITRHEWEVAARLDGVMNGLAGYATVLPERTLDRMINEIILLEEAGMTDATLPPEEVEARVLEMEGNWGLGDAMVVKALEENGLTRDDLLRRVERLMLVEQAIALLESEHDDFVTWLSDARKEADITMYVDTESVMPTVTVVIPTPESPLPIPTSPDSPPAAADMAPDFSLPDGKGNFITLGDFRGEKSVVLAFFRGKG